MASKNLDSMLRSATNAYVTVSEKATETRTKVTQEDLALPLRLLKYRDRDLPKCGLSKKVLPEDASEMDTLGNNGIKLEKRNNYSLLSVLCHELQASLKLTSNTLKYLVDERIWLASLDLLISLIKSIPSIFTSPIIVALVLSIPVRF